MNLPEELSERDRELLVSAVEKWAPELQPLLSILGQRELNQDERENLRGALLSEMVASGLDDKDNATAYGKELDDVIGRLMFF